MRRAYIIEVKLLLQFVGVKVGVANFFLGQSIGIDKNNTFHFYTEKILTF